jgi:two-component system CheB/CheR fusion protein
LDIGLPVEQLRTPVRAVLNSEAASQTLTLDAFTRRGKPIQCRLSCAPLIGADQQVDGVVLLMEEWHAT